MRAAAARRGGGTALAALAAVVLLCPGPDAALAQQAVAAGRVVRPGPADTVPIAGLRVVLHRVGRDSQGPLDSVVSAAGGRFRFRYAADTAAVYLLSARYRDIEYFSRPLAGEAARPDTGVSLVVHDTSSTAPVGLAARHVVITRPAEDGTREVIDLVVLRNDGHLARVAPDSLGASWTMPLPPGSEGLEVGESDFSREAATRRGDTLALGAPIGPGEKQLSLQYHLPAGRTAAAIPVGSAGGVMNLLLEERGAVVTGPGLAAADTQVVLGRTFRRWTGEVPAGALVRVSLPGPAGGPGWLLPTLVGLVALALALAGWRLARRTPGRDAAAAPVPDGRADLLERIARLDARYAGRQAEVAAEEWDRYLEERARLKGELERGLATGPPGR